jgi:hypothetical protein
MSQRVTFKIKLCGAPMIRALVVAAFVVAATAIGAAAPAVASPYANCSEANADGVYNIGCGAPSVATRYFRGNVISPEVGIVPRPFAVNRAPYVCWRR